MPLLLLLFIVYLLIVDQSFTVLSDLMTHTVLTFGWFRSLEYQLTPVMICIILALLHLLHLQACGTAIAVVLMRNGTSQNVLISWNCLGWQRVIILLLTFAAAFPLGYSWAAKFKLLLPGSQSPPEGLSGQQVRRGRPHGLCACLGTVRGPPFP
jgi:hypothetical protein